MWLRVDQIVDSTLKQLQLQVASEQLQCGYLPRLTLTAKESREKGERVNPLLHDDPQLSSLSLLLVL